MATINILDENIVAKIAAGEVIERPASIVKELLENALDAGTKTIEILVEQAGKTLIKISDSGSGIEPTELKKVFLRHATSKIKTAEDIFMVRSLGFRGEALYSIAAVSDITLSTKTKDQSNGYQINSCGLKTSLIKPCAKNIGTTIEVRRLFFNTPARKKFLKTDATELNQIINVVTPYAIIRYDLDFILKTPQKVIYSLRADTNLTKRFARALNINETNLISVTTLIKQNNINLRLILGDINLKRPTKNNQFIFINNRAVDNRAISYHLNQAYKLILPSQQYPVFAALIDLDPSLSDVNIHPRKLQVKLKDESLIAEQIYQLAKDALINYTKPQQFAKFSEPANPTSPRYTLTDTSKYNFAQKIDFKAELSSDTETIFLANQQSLKEKLKTATYLGLLLKKYLLCESTNSLLLIDQHAAQERLTYETLKNQAKHNQLEIQNLLTPVILKLSPAEMLTWEQNQTQIEQFGFATTLFSADSIAVHSHPILIPLIEVALRDILAAKDELLDLDKLAKRACTNSLKTGYIMEKQQANYLIKSLLNCQTPFICPHGRPTVIEITLNDINRQFLR